MWGTDKALGGWRGGIHEEERECFSRDPRMHYCLDIKTHAIIRMFKNERKQSLEEIKVSLARPNIS